MTCWLNDCGGFWGFRLTDSSWHQSGVLAGKFLGETGVKWGYATASEQICNGGGTA